jgi:hypothetical protein
MEGQTDGGTDRWRDSIPIAAILGDKYRVPFSPRTQIVAGPGSNLPPGLRRWRDECVFERTKLPSMGYFDDYGPNGILEMALLGRLRVRGKGLRPS